MSLNKDAKSEFNRALIELRCIKPPPKEPFSESKNLKPKSKASTVRTLKDDYFAKLTSYKDVKCTTNKLLTEVSGETVMNMGLYTFSYMDDSGKMKSIPSRFTFVYRNYNHHWLIIHHHSSVLPSEK